MLRPDDDRPRPPRGPTPWDPLDDYAAQVRTQLANIAQHGRMTCPLSARAALAIAMLGAEREGRLTDAGCALLVALQTGSPVHLPHIPAPWDRRGGDPDDVRSSEPRRRPRRPADRPATRSTPSAPTTGAPETVTFSKRVVGAERASGPRPPGAAPEPAPPVPILQVSLFD